MSTHDDSVQVSAPAVPASAALMRTVAASAAARTDLPIDAVDDLRIAVAEACAWLLTANRQADRLLMGVIPDGMGVEVRVSIEPASDLADQASRDSLSWRVIEGLTDRVEETVEGGRHTIALRVGAEDVSRRR